LNNNQRITNKTGLPPGTPTYIGNTSPEPTSVSVLIYSDKDFTGFHPVTPEELPEIVPSDSNAWIQISGFADVDLIERVLLRFSVHPLVIEDVLNTKTRSKIDEFDEYLFIVLANLQNDSINIRKDQVSIILTKNILITCSESAGLFKEIESRIQRSTGRFRDYGIDYLAYTIIDIIVDGYFTILESFEERIEELEDEVVKATRKDAISNIQHFRHDLIWFRRLVWALRELVIRLERTDSLLISNTTHLYLRDVYDHGVKISEDVDVYREMIEGLMDIYLSNIANHTNEIMKVLTVITTIFMPLSFIAGIYGMNFENMPEKSHPYGYPSVLISMAVIASVMIWYFRHKKWI